MKRLFVIAFLFVTAVGFSQEGVKVEKNKVTIKQTPPVWPGCEKSADVKKCFNQKLMTHIRENYKYPKNDAGEYVRGKVTIKLEINEKGEAVIKSLEGDKPEVKAAVRNMIEAMPKMKPGMSGGKPSAVSYTIPLNL